jgi:hypothetical protein
MDLVNSYSYIAIKMLGSFALKWGIDEIEDQT